MDGWVGEKIDGWVGRWGMDGWKKRVLYHSMEYRLEVGRYYYCTVGR